MKTIWYLVLDLVMVSISFLTLYCFSYFDKKQMIFIFSFQQQHMISMYSAFTLIIGLVMDLKKFLHDIKKFFHIWIYQVIIHFLTDPLRVGSYRWTKQYFELYLQYENELNR